MRFRLMIHFTHLQDSITISIIPFVPLGWNRGTNGHLKGSGINKRKVSQTKLQRGFGRHGSGAMCTQRALCVSSSAPYSCGVLTQPHTHTPAA